MIATLNFIHSVAIHDENVKKIVVIMLIQYKRLFFLIF